MGYRVSGDRRNSDDMEQPSVSMEEDIVRTFAFSRISPNDSLGDILGGGSGPSHGRITFFDAAFAALDDITPVTLPPVDPPSA
jgi:hypothetical protein